MAAAIPERWLKVTRDRLRPLGRVAVEQHDRDVRLAQQLDGGRVALLGERQDQPVDAALLQQPDVLGIQVGVALGVRQQQRVAGLPQPALGARDRRGEHGVRDVGDREPDRERLARAQPLREHVRAGSRGRAPPR